MSSKRRYMMRRHVPYKESKVEEMMLLKTKHYYNAAQEKCK